MKINKKGFSLVELLVVITILSIISVVAYQNFGGATDKATASRKVTDISTIENSLMLFHTDKKYYPMPQVYDNTAGSENLWGYDDSLETTSSNKIQVVYNGQEIDSIVDTTTNGGGKLEVTNTDDSLDYQIGAKGVIGYNGEFNKTYLSKELYDPELGDTKVGANKMIDYGIGKYVYGVYALPKVSNWNVSGSSGSYYNIATTIKKAGSELYETYIVGNYDENSCSLPGFDTCPKTLIGDLENGTIQSTSTGTQDDNQGIPYPIRDFNQ